MMTMMALFNGRKVGFLQMLHVCVFQPYLRNFSLWTASWQSFTSECSLFNTSVAGVRSVKFISESEPWGKNISVHVYMYIACPIRFLVDLSGL